MRYGLSLFPVLEPGEKSAVDYYDESLRLVELAERLGYDHVQIVEHYLGAYGGYSPDPVTFLAAAAMRTSRLRLITGACIPAFAHPVQLAARLALLDTLSHGRLGVGFGRAFLPAEFATFGVDMDSSRERFAAGVRACLRLWTERDVVVDDGFHAFGPITSLPPVVQQPHPPVYLASAMSPQTCAAAGRDGHRLQVVPTITSADGVAGMIDAYRAGRGEAGLEPTGGEVQLKYTCYLGEDGPAVLRRAEELERNYVAKMTDVVAAWSGTRSAAYAGYEQLAGKVAGYDFAAAHAADKVLAGEPAYVAAQLTRIRERFGADVSVSCVFNPGYLGIAESETAVRLFAERVVPAVTDPAPVPAR